MSDEEIIRRKLIFDGDGTGVERRINLLQKHIAAWVSGKNEMSEDENSEMLNKSLSLLSSLETSWAKSELMRKCNQQELEMYKKFHERIEKNIEGIKETIVTSKIVLLNVQREKQQKLNYNMIAEDISAMPSRIETTRIVKKLNEELLERKTQNSKLNADWMKWRQHFKVITTSANQLSEMLEFEY